MKVHQKKAEVQAFGTRLFLNIQVFSSSSKLARKLLTRVTAMVLVFNLVLRVSHEHVI